MYAFDRQWQNSPTQLVQIILSVGENAELGMQSPRLCHYHIGSNGAK